MLNAEHDVAAGSAAFPLWLYPALQVPKLSHRQSEEFEEAEEEDQLERILIRWEWDLELLEKLWQSWQF